MTKKGGARAPAKKQVPGTARGLGIIAGVAPDLFGKQPRWYPTGLDGDALERRRAAWIEVTEGWTADQFIDCLLAYDVSRQAIEEKLLAMMSRVDADASLRSARSATREARVPLVPYLLGRLAGKNQSRSDAARRNASKPRSKKKLTDSALEQDVAAWDKTHKSRRGLIGHIERKWGIDPKTARKRIQSLAKR